MGTIRLINPAPKKALTRESWRAVRPKPHNSRAMSRGIQTWQTRSKV